MSDFQPYFTADGSLGLYNSDYNDIYHSASGALTEAYEKFVYPIDFSVLKNKSKIKILDLCFGIGYNTKSFLNFILNSKNFFKKYSLTNNNIEAIYTNNIFTKIYSIFIYGNKLYNDTIHTDNIFDKIYIKAVDMDEKLFYLSPFVNTGVKKINNENINFPIEKKYFNSFKNFKYKKISNLINYLFFNIFISGICSNSDVISILNDKKYNQYFEKNLRGILSLVLLKNNILSVSKTKSSFLHNIYYKYISNCYKLGLKLTNLDKIKFEYKIEDARVTVKNDNNLYNLIFLDAFTPSKCPSLWSYDFFKELYKHLECDGMLLTYSKSASIRSAMLEAGFYIGYIYDENSKKCVGTVAVKNYDLINYPLSEFDFGLLKTRAGIFYRDENLTASNEAIIKSHDLEVKNSERISSTKYIKNYKRNFTVNS